MRTLTILLLLFYINSNGQQTKKFKRYLDIVAINLKYNTIKTRYQSLVAENKEDLINNYGVYFKKSAVTEERNDNEKWIDPMKSDSVLLLAEGDKTYFIDDKGMTEDIYTLKNGKLIESASGFKNSKRIYWIDNLIDETSARYDYDSGTIYLGHYVQDKFDPAKRDILLEQKFVNNQLISQTNYQKDFRTSQKQMLKNLPNNFYNSAQNYLKKQCLKENISLENCTMMNDRISKLKEDLNMAIVKKNNFYREIRIHKGYNEKNYPIYKVHIYFQSELWEIQIDGKTNMVLSIDHELLNG